jgi:hypothetical protein
VGAHGNGQLAPPGPSPFLYSSSSAEARGLADGLSGDIWAADSARIANQQQQNDESLPMDLGSVVPRMMMYPDGGPWLPETSYNSPFPVAGSLHYLTDHDTMHQRDLSSDEKEQCEKCDQRRQKRTPEKISASNTYRGSNSSNSSGSSVHGGMQATGSLVASPVSPATVSTSPTLSRVMRDHSIELDHLISQTTHSRYPSIGGASTEEAGGGTSHSQLLKRRYSDINGMAAVGASGVPHIRQPQPQPQPQLATLLNMPEQKQYDVIEKHEYIQGQDDIEDSEAKITKVVVIYMQERQR